MEKEGGKKGWKSRKIGRFLFGILSAMKTVGGH